MRETVKRVEFNNKTSTKSFFQVIKVEELLTRSLNHDICQVHIVNFYIIFFVCKGSGTHTIDLLDYPYQEGSILLVRKDQIQKFSKSKIVKGYLLIFTEDFILGHLNNLEALKTLQLFNEFLSYPKIDLEGKAFKFSSFIELVKQLEQESTNEDEYSEGIARSLLHIVIAKLYRIKSVEGHLSEKKKYLEEFIAFQSMVEQDCFNSKKVADYAARLAMSTKTLNKVVQAVVNKPAKVFIDEIVIIQIKRLLFGTRLSIKEIAFNAGFDDPANFTKYFKKLVGDSPDLFRQAHR